MIKLDNYNHDTKYAEFSVSAASEISSLPTTTNGGTGAGAGLTPVAAGSIAYVTDADMDFYVLNGASDTWIKTNF